MKFKNLLSLIFGLFFIAGHSQQYIAVSSKTPDELVRDIFIGTQNAGCITVSNVTVNGWQDYGNNPFSYGYFEKGTLPFPLEKGIILSTGEASKATGPNTSLLSDGGSSWLGDTDLAKAFQSSPSNYINATSLEFDFVGNNTTGISFEYMLLSEEYQTSGCSYFDSFAFLIKRDGDPNYNNIALIPGTSEPVSSQTVRGGTDCPRNPQYFDQFNYPPDSPRQDSPTNYDGQTKVLTAKTDIVPGQKYHIKLVIADYRTTSHDSAVFLKAGSFVGKKDLGIDLLNANQNAICEGSNKNLDATTVGATSYQWYKDGIILPAETHAKLNITGTLSSAGNYEVQLQVGGCLLKGSIQVEIAEKPIVKKKSFCNYNDGNPIEINLQNLNASIISNYKNYFRVKYFADATHNIPLPDNYTYTSDQDLFVEVESGNCAKVDQTVYLNTPKKSLLLANQNICPDATARLEAEVGYQYYKWMNENGGVIAEGSTTNFIDNVPVGKYSVELTSMNGCSLIQTVEVTAAEIPQIVNIDVTGNTATVYVKGGKPPYEYASDNGSYQSSNVFTNVPRGLHSIYVKDSSNCEIIAKEFLIINLVNVITPNGDGQNDTLDYSDLKIKKDVSVTIYDRFGSLVFQSQNQKYIWDGKLNGRVLPTGNYWYILNWTEPATNVPVSYKGWILLKNRN